jgi:hypothetical protein
MDSWPTFGSDCAFTIAGSDAESKRRLIGHDEIFHSVIHYCSSMRAGNADVCAAQVSQICKSSGHDCGEDAKHHGNAVDSEEVEIAQEAYQQVEREEERRHEAGVCSERKQITGASLATSPQADVPVSNTLTFATPGNRAGGLVFQRINLRSGRVFRDSAESG